MRSGAGAYAFDATSGVGRPRSVEPRGRSFAESLAGTGEEMVVVLVVVVVTVDLVVVVSTAAAVTWVTDGAGIAAAGCSWGSGAWLHDTTAMARTNALRAFTRSSGLVGDAATDRCTQSTAIRHPALPGSLNGVYGEW